MGIGVLDPAPSSPLKIRCFVDFWNLQLTLNEMTARQFKLDWLKLPNVLVQAAAQQLKTTNVSYDGTIVFTSYNPNSEEGKKYRKWAEGWLDLQTGIQVKCYKRRLKNHPTCPVCHKVVRECPHDGCGGDMAGTIEKGVDTAIATDMIRLAWENAYQVAILATADADLVPAVEFLDQKGIRVIQAGFPSHGNRLARACWSTVNVSKLLGQIER